MKVKVNEKTVNVDDEEWTKKQQGKETDEQD